MRKGIERVKHAGRVEDVEGAGSSCKTGSG